MYRFCVFEIFVRRAKTELVELFHIAHGAAHILIPLYAHRQGHVTDRETVYKHIFVRPSQSCQPSTRRLAVDFTSCCRFSPNYTYLTCGYFILQRGQSPKQLSNSVHLPLFVRFSHSPITAILSTNASPRLFHILTSFVRRSPITMLTNRPRHGPWRGLGDSAFVAGNSMNEIVA